MAIQFDVASAVFARLQRQETGVYGDSKVAMEDKFAAILAGLANRVPNDIDLLFHFCLRRQRAMLHVVEPTSASPTWVDAGTTQLSTPDPRGASDLIHMPVPRHCSGRCVFQRRW